MVTWDKHGVYIFVDINGNQWFQIPVLNICYILNHANTCSIFDTSPIIIIDSSGIPQKLTQIIILNNRVISVIL